MCVCVSFINFLQVWLAVLGIAALAARQHFPKKSISVMLHNPKKWLETGCCHFLDQSQKCCSNATWPLQLKVDAMRNVILRHSSIDSEFTVKQSKTCRCWAWVTVWPTANASGGGKKIGYCCLIQCTQEKYTPKTWSWYFIWTTTFWSLSVQSRVFFRGREMCIFFQLKNIPWHSVNHFHQPAACLLCGL